MNILVEDIFFGGFNTPAIITYNLGFIELKPYNPVISTIEAVSLFLGYITLHLTGSNGFTAVT